MKALALAGHSAFTVAAEGQSDFLQPGVYHVWAAADASIKVGVVADDVTVETGYLVKAGEKVAVQITPINHRIGATAEITVHRVG